jgi:hypothetical protein
MNGKGCGRKRSWPNIRYYPGIFLEGLRKTTKNLSQDIQALGRDLNLGPPEYEGLSLSHNVYWVVMSGGYQCFRGTYASTIF